MGSYEVEFEDDCLRVATIDNVQLATWYGVPSLDHMRTIDRVFKKLKRRTDGGVAFINVIVGGVPRFSQEVREEAARQTAEDDGKDLATCHVILVGGMVGSAVRAFMSTTILVGRPPHPTKVFGDTTSAARWMAIQLGRNETYSWNEARLMDIIGQSAMPMAAEG